MYNCLRKRKKGFSLIELMVVISIIFILLGIIMASISAAREKSRDERRVSDISNIALALTLYKEKNRSYPVYPNGIELGKGGELDDDIKLFNGNTYADPLSEEAEEYSYWYYSNFACNGELVNVVLAKSVERSGTSNLNEVCGGGAILPMETGLVHSAYAFSQVLQQSSNPQTSSYSQNSSYGSGSQTGSQSGLQTPSCSGVIITPSIVQKSLTAAVPVTISWAGQVNARITITRTSNISNTFYSGSSGSSYNGGNEDRYGAGQSSYYPSPRTLNIGSTYPSGTYAVTWLSENTARECQSTFQVIDAPLFDELFNGSYVMILK